MLRATVCYNIATVDKADEAEAAPNEPLVHTIHMYKYAQMCLYHIVCSSVAKYSYLYNMAIHNRFGNHLCKRFLKPTILARLFCGSEGRLYLCSKISICPTNINGGRTV